jgi:hypothetical protein
MARPTEKQPESLEELRSRIAAQGEEERARIAEAGRELDAFAAARLKAAEATQAEREAALRTQRAASFDAAHKSDARAAFLRSGGVEGEFDAAWPELRTKLVESQTLDAARQRKQWQKQAARRYR